MIAVSLNIGGGVRFIKPAKLYMCTQTHYKHDEDGRTVPVVRGYGSVPLSHSGNVVTRIELHKHTLVIQICKQDYCAYSSFIYPVFFLLIYLLQFSFV